ncbi:MAG: hypothetical protein M1812_005676 [Candelaria pacifica]|nr:MAG: hypothetical protein M1812_005676 [Candelaria pacifica]
MVDVVSTTGEDVVTVFTEPSRVELLCDGPLPAFELKLAGVDTELVVADGRGTVNVTVVGVGAQLLQTVTVVVQPFTPKVEEVTITDTGVDEVFLVEVILLEMVLPEVVLSRLVVVGEVEPPVESIDCVDETEDVEFHPPNEDEGVTLELINAVAEVLDFVPIGERSVPVASIVIVEVLVGVLVAELVCREPDLDEVVDADLVSDVELDNGAVPVDGMTVDVSVLFRVLVEVVNLAEPVPEVVVTRD